MSYKLLINYLIKCCFETINMGHEVQGEPNPYMYPQKPHQIKFVFWCISESTNKCMALITKVVRISHSVIMMNYILALVNIIVNSPPQGLNFFCGKERIVRNGLSPVIYLFVNFVSLEQYISKRRNCNCVKGKVFATKFTDKCTWFNL